MAAHWNYVASGDGCSGADGDNSFVRWLPIGKTLFFRKFAFRKEYNP